MTLIDAPAVATHSQGSRRMPSGAITLSTGNHSVLESCASITIDYGRCEGGIPVLEIQDAESKNHEPLHLRVIYSETADGIEMENGDGPFFLFSSAMDSYRSVELQIDSSPTPQQVPSYFVQGSQRYQKVILLSPDSSITFTKIVFQPVRPQRVPKARFTCSDEQLNCIWEDGVRTLDMCTLEAGEVTPAWESTSIGTRIRGQHWCPCRLGTRWTDKVITFEAKIESCGASWGVHMVANGLIYCIDRATRKLRSFEGLADKGAVFPSITKGDWDLPVDLCLEEWLKIRTVCSGTSVSIWINNSLICTVDELAIRPVLGGEVNSGSVAFGGPAGWISIYRQLIVQSVTGEMLYDNDLSVENEARTFADFQVGTNSVACTIDGAKRDRACFGGDLLISGRSIAYAGMDLEAVAGSIKLLTSHQTSDGYLGNLCPVQAPLHDGTDEPPTYAFYSLTYALQLAVAIKDYYLHTGDDILVAKVYSSLEKLHKFVETHLGTDGLVHVPPPLAMTWFPMGGPIFGCSAGINLAYYDFLQSMRFLTTDKAGQQYFQRLVSNLKSKLLAKFYDSDTGIFRMADSLPADGISQDINGYATALGLLPPHPNLDNNCGVSSDDTPPLAFRSLNHWSKTSIISPYATSFALSALFSRSRGPSAIALLRRVWGPMADRTGPNYSGGHWEAMDAGGKPFNHDVSLMHAWSTAPVALLPRYLVGLKVLEPGWKVIQVKPVKTDVRWAEYVNEIRSRRVKMRIEWEEGQAAKGLLIAEVPAGMKALAVAPEGYRIEGETTLVGPCSSMVQLIPIASLDVAAAQPATRMSDSDASSAIKAHESTTSISPSDTGKETHWLSRLLRFLPCLK